jgi:predicted phage terminase large subunit-like protein
MDPRKIGKPHRLVPSTAEAAPVSPATAPSPGMSSEDIRKLFEIRREQWRRLCRQNLLACATALLEPRGYTPAQHHELFCREIEAVVRGQNPRLILISPRGSAKSTYASNISPAWLFAMRPGARIIAVSHTEDLAAQISRCVMRFINENSELLGYTLVNDAAGRWSTSNGCEYFARGVGQPARGFKADLIIIDDPIRSRQEAESETSRNSLWEYVNSDLLPCLLPKGGVILIGTAYHELDIMCRFEREQPEIWRTVRLCAISDGPDTDPLGRPAGIPLWADDENFGYGTRLLELQAEYERHGRSRDRASQFQGRPTPPEGSLFKPGKMPVYAGVPSNLLRTIVVRGWDFAASAGRGDYTAGIKVALLFDPVLGEDRWVITDVQRDQASPEDAMRLLLTTAQLDGHDVTQVLPEDPGAAGKIAAADMVRRLAGHTVVTERITGSKESLARPVATQANAGNVGMLQAPWNAALIAELASFPNGAHDDMVDALSIAFTQLFASKLSEWYRL